MPLYLHLSIHLFFAILAGLIIWLIYKKPIICLVGGVIGGFLIDFDHFIDYLIVFGFNFKFDYFFNGYQFLKSDKIYILFHGWEYVIILVILGLILAKNKKIYPVASVSCATEYPTTNHGYATGATAFIFALALGAFFHLATDVVLNEGLTAKSYSIIFRAKNGFQMNNIVTPEHWKSHQLKKIEANFK